MATESPVYRCGGGVASSAPKLINIFKMIICEKAY